MDFKLKIAFRIYGWLFCFAISLSACNEVEIEGSALVKPQPIGSNEINIFVDNSLDFSGYRVHTVLDSASLDNPLEKLYGPEDIVSPLIFTEEISGEVMAVVPYDSQETEVRINSQKVTESLLFLLPAFHALDQEQRAGFLLNAKQLPEYLSFEEAVDALLKARKSVYSDDEGFISLAIALNESLVSSYLNARNTPGGKTSQTQAEFSNWVNRENGASFVNQVRSYVHVEFDPIGPGEGVSILAAPRNFYLAPEPVPLSQYQVPDNCYTVRISQSNSEAFSRNALELTKTSVSILFDALFGTLGTSRTDCIAKIAGSLQSSINGIVLNSATSDNQAQEVFIGVIKAVRDAAFTNASEIQCAKYFTSKSTIYKALAKKAIFLGQLIEGLGLLKSGSEAIPYVISLIDGVELEEVMQLYQGSLIEACVRLEADVTLNPEYPTGDQLFVKVKLMPQSEYANWRRSGFKISWSLPPFNGTVIESQSSTDDAGLADALWTLPNEENAVVTLTAELKDKEDDHLSGSPLNFQVRLIELDSTQIYMESAIGSYIVNGPPAVGNGPDSKLFCELKEDGLAKYTIYNDPSWPDGYFWYISWYVKKINSQYFILTGWTNPGFILSDAKPLTYPVKDFVYRHSYVKDK